MNVDLICIVCPKGCHLTVKGEMNSLEVEGNSCKRGIIYGIHEITNPKRMVTSTVSVKGGLYPRLPVMTSDVIPKALIFDVMKEINRICVQTPIQMGQTLLKNVLNTGCDIVATRSMESLDQ